MKTKKIQPGNAFYIKLGRGGARERECIEKGQLWLGYHEVPHELCLQGDWEGVKRDFMERGDAAGTASNHLRQVRTFYEASPNDLWITFFGDSLWWGFAGEPIALERGGSKTRPMLDGWHNESIDGKVLRKSSLSGRLLSVEGYRGTICSVRAAAYLVRKINGEQSPVEETVREAQEQLLEGLEMLIKNLSWQDFELLVDLIFRQAGWQRVGELGGDQKTIDLELFSPISNERFYVQVKSKAGRDQFESFQRAGDDESEYSRRYFVVHSPQDSLIKEMETDRDLLWVAGDLADLVFRYGLTDWLLDKGG